MADGQAENPPNWEQLLSHDYEHRGHYGSGDDSLAGRAAFQEFNRAGGMAYLEHGASVDKYMKAVEAGHRVAEKLSKDTTGLPYKWSGSTMRKASDNRRTMAVSDIHNTAQYLR